MTVPLGASISGGQAQALARPQARRSPQSPRGWALGRARALGQLRVSPTAERKGKRICTPELPAGGLSHRPARSPINRRQLA